MECYRYSYTSLTKYLCLEFEKANILTGYHFWRAFVSGKWTMMDKGTTSTGVVIVHGPTLRRALLLEEPTP